MGASVAPTDPVSDPQAAAPPRRGRRSHPVLWFVLRRIGGGLLTLFVVSILVFAATEVLPGDAAGAILGRNASDENLAEVRGLMGLDDPAAQRYAEWLGGLVTGDLGNSAAGYAQGTELPIWDEVSDKLLNSLILAGIAALLMVPISLFLGVMAAVRAGRPHGPRDLADLAGGHLAAGVRGRLAADPRLLLVARRAAVGGAHPARRPARSPSRTRSSSRC